MSSRLLLVVFALLEAALVFACVRIQAPKIQQELTAAAAAALEANDISLGEGLVIDGRDAWLTGLVSTSDASNRAESILASVPGIRLVHNHLTVAGGTAPIPTEPALAEPEETAEQVQRSIDDLIAGRVVEFEPTRDRLTPRGRDLVDELAALLVRFPNAEIEIAGHTDSLGDSRSNLDLSQRRANAVRQRLIEQGVDGARLTAVGYGEERPVAENDTEEGRLQNRRVELIVQ